jgi:hypothetical protein
MCPIDWLDIVREIVGCAAIVGVAFAIAWAIRP